MRTEGGGKRYAGKPSCRLAGGVCRSSISPCDPARGVCRSTICSCTLATGDLVHQMCSRDLATGDLVYQMCSCNLFRSFREMFQCWFKHGCQTNQSKSVLSSSWRCFLRRFFDLASASDVLLKTASCSLRENCHFSRQQISCS